MSAWTKTKEFLKPVLRSAVCLILCAALILGCFPQKAEAVALEAALGIGVAACLILMTAGVVFNPKTVEDIKAIGQSFQTYMYQWGTEAEKLDEVKEWFGGLSVLDPDDGNDGWGNRKMKITIARGILTGISLWIAAAIAGTYRPSLPSASTKLDFIPVNYASEVNVLGSWDTLSFNPPIEISYNGSFDGQIMRVPTSESKQGSVTYFSIPFSLEAGYYELDFDTVTFYRPYSGVCLYLSIVRFDPSTEKCSEVVYNYLTGKTGITSSYSGLCRFYANESYKYFVRLGFVGNASLYDETMGLDFGKAVEIVSDEASSSDPVFVGDVATDVEAGNIAAEEIPLQDIDYALALPKGQTVLESIQNISQSMSSGNMSLEEYQEMTYAGSASAETPVWTLNLPLSQILTYDQGAAAEPLTVEATVTDGGTVTYEWYRYGTDAEGEVYPADVFATGNTFTPPTDVAQTAYYYCRAINTDPDGYVAWDYSNSIAVQVNPVTDPGTDTDPDAGTDTDSDNLTAEQIGSAVGDAFNQAGQSEKTEASNTGSDLVGQLTDVIPNYSEGFVTALGAFASNFSYEGTDAILTVPQIRFPEIPGKTKGPPLVKSFVMMDEKQVDFSEFAEMIPEQLLLLVQCLLTAALIVFCGKELYDTISYVLTLRKGE